MSSNIEILEKIKGKNSEKFTIAIDWLEINCLSDFVAELENEIIQEKGYYYQINVDLGLNFIGGSKNYKSVLEVFFKGEKVAYICCHPRSFEIMKPNQCSLKLENKILYTEEWFEILEYLRENLKIHFKNITRIDIAVDGVNFLYDFLNDYIRGKYKNEILKIGRAKFNAYQFNEKNLSFENFTLGKPSSDKMMSFYMKSKEIKDSGKYYILDFWRKNGLDVKKIFRAEIRLKNEYLKYIKDFNYKNLKDKNYVLSLFKRSIKNYFDFAVKSKKDSNISRMERLDLFNFDLSDLQNLDFEKVKDESDIAKIKVAIHLLEKMKLTKVMDAEIISLINNLIDYLVNVANLESWYKFKQKQWRGFYEYYSKMKIYKEVYKELSK